MFIDANLLKIQIIMKNTNNKINMDAMAEARRDKLFQKYSDNAEVKLRLSIEVFKKRESFNLNQQKLAKKIGTTQKVISKIENAEVNLGIDLLGRIIRSLDFSSNDLAKIFGCSLVLPRELLLIDYKTESSFDNKIMSNILDNRVEIEYQTNELN